ncbi:FAD-dependent oxidoreductase [Arthrobacter sp. TE12232]
MPKPRSADHQWAAAQYALRYFAHETENRFYALDGMQSIPRTLAERLAPGVLRLNTPVTGITRKQDSEGNGYFKLSVDGSEPVEAREVVLAVPAPVALALAPDLPQWKRAALEVVKTPGSTTFGVTVDATGIDGIDDWAFVITADRAFDVIINPQPGAGRVDAEGRKIVQFVCYGNSSGYRPDLVEGDAGTQAWLEDFLAVAPELRGRVLGPTFRPGSTASRSSHPNASPPWTRCRNP